MSIFNDIKTDFYAVLEEWFINQRIKIENDWQDLIEKYKNESHLGKIILFQMGRSRSSKIEGEVTKYLKTRFSWNDSEFNFYFNAICADMSREEYSEQKSHLKSILGEPDVVFNYFGLDEPSWTNGIIKIQLRHIDTHGGGYERIEIEIDKDYLIKSQKII